MDGLPPRETGSQSGGGGGDARGGGEVDDGVVLGAEVGRPGGEGCIGRVEGLGGVQALFPSPGLKPETKVERGEGVEVGEDQQRRGRGKYSAKRK